MKVLRWKYNNIYYYRAQLQKHYRTRLIHSDWKTLDLYIYDKKTGDKIGEAVAGYIEK